MRVRTAEPGDLDAVLRLIRDTPTLPQWDRKDLATGQANEAEDTLLRRLLVAESDGVVLGFAQYSLLLREAELEAMGVVAAQRRHGVGRALLDAVMHGAKEAGAVRMHLEVRAGNAAAIALYRSTGLQEMGKRPAYYREPVEDALLMQRSWPP